MSIEKGQEDVRTVLRKLQDETPGQPKSEKPAYTLLKQLKVLSRDPQLARPGLYNDQGLFILSQWAFEEDSKRVYREALRCIANTLFLDEPSRDRFINAGKLPAVVERLKSEEAEDDFLCYRILLLSTYCKSTANFAALLSQQGLAAKFKKSLSRFIDTYDFSIPLPDAASEMEVMALNDCVKALFNISHLYTLSQYFEHSIKPLLEITCKIAVPNTPFSQPLKVPVMSVIHALMELFSARDKEELSDEVKAEIIQMGAAPVDKLIHLLDFTLISCESDESFSSHGKGQSMPSLSLTDEIDSSLVSVFSILAHLSALSPDKDGPVQQSLRAKLLPADWERERPLGQSDSLNSRILQLNSASLGKNAAKAGMHLLFELSDRDPSTFVENVGYGHGAGYMSAHKISFPKDQLKKKEAAAAAAVAGKHRAKGLVNPITGQSLEAEAAGAVKMPPMSDAEKEREAERLFVLFERLRANGVVDVKNPVAEAAAAGKLVDVKGSEGSESDDEVLDKGWMPYMGHKSKS